MSPYQSINKLAVKKHSLTSFIFLWEQMNEGGPPKSTWVYKKLYIYSLIFKLQSPSKYSPFDGICLSRCLNSSILMPFTTFFKKDFIYLLLGEGRGGRKTSMCERYIDWDLNLQSFGSQAGCSTHWATPARAILMPLSVLFFVSPLTHWQNISLWGLARDEIGWIWRVGQGCHDVFCVDRCACKLPIMKQAKELRLQKKSLKLWIEHELQTKGSPVQFLVRAHAWVAGQVPSAGHERQPHIDVSLPLSPSFPFSLKINKIFKNENSLKLNATSHSKVSWTLTHMGFQNSHLAGEACTTRGLTTRR